MVRSFHLVLLRFSVLALIASPDATLRADTSIEPDAHAQHDGVTLDAYSRNGQITFCFSAEKGVKIASEYGVEFKVPQGEAKYWNESLPKLFAGSEPYFDLPVRIELKTRGIPNMRQVSIGLGVCVSTQYCTPVTFQITVPTNRAGHQAVVCTNQM
jgi:hypothetical protein